MTATTTDKEVSPQDTLAAAENVYKSTQAAADAALAAASRRELDDAEAAAVQAIADAVTGEGDRATADAARARVEQLRRDHEWAAVELAAAERATARAYADVVSARRGVVAQEYVAAHKTHNDPTTRLNVLLAQLPDLIAELIPLVADRDALHRRLDREVWHWPHEERPALPAGEPLVAPDSNAAPLVAVLVPRGAVSDAVDAGITKARVAAAERQRAAGQG